MNNILTERRKKIIINIKMNVARERERKKEADHAFKTFITNVENITKHKNVR